MDLQLDPRRRTPIYLQIVQQVKHLVAAGRLHPGDQLPTVRALAVQLHVHTNTVARAYAVLDQDGVISTQQGRGTYIARHAADASSVSHRQIELAARLDRVVVDALSLGYSPAEITAAFQRSLKQWPRTLKRRKGKT